MKKEEKRKTKKIIFIVITLIILAIIIYLTISLKTPKPSPTCGNKICEAEENNIICPSDCPIPICNNNNICEGFENHNNCLSDCQGQAISPEFKKIIDNIWNNKKEYFTEQINNNLNLVETNIIYNIQIWTNNLLDYGTLTKNYNLLDNLTEIYLTAYDYLKLRDNYTYYYHPNGGGARETVLPLNPPAYMWIDNYSQSFDLEDVLSSSQYLYLLSRTTNAILEVEESKRTEKMKEFLERSPEIIITHHYYRWIFNDKRFQVVGWGCASGIFNHYEFIQVKRERGLGEYVSYCNSVTDTDMWIIAGVTEMLASYNKNSDLILENNLSFKDLMEKPVSLNETNITLEQAFLDYIDKGTELLESRLNESQLTNFEGKSVKGVNFDLGVWDDHPTYGYANYTGETFPTDPSPSQNVGWDISHARRFVNVFNTLHKNRNTTNQSFPDKDIMTKFTNQIIYGAFNKDFQKPLFSNYMNGLNGWYRVGYHGPGFAYAPFDRSITFATGGYGAWSDYNSDLEKVTSTIWRSLESVYTLDNTGYQNDGIINNITWTNNSKKNGGFVFNGNNSYVYVGSPKELNELITGNFSFTTWINLNEDLEKINPTWYILQHAFAWVIRLQRLEPGSGWRVQFIANAQAPGVSQIAQTSYGKIQPDTWHHIALTRDENSVGIYIDGIDETASSGPTIEIRKPNNPLIIGTSSGLEENRFFNGKMDEVKIYDKTLSSKEINQDYLGSFNNSLISHWSFDKEPDLEMIEFIREYYAGVHYSNYKRIKPNLDYGKSDSFNLLMFLPSLATKVNCNYNDLCEDGETIENCPNDCNIEENENQEKSLERRVGDMKINKTSDILVPEVPSTKAPIKYLDIGTEISFLSIVNDEEVILRINNKNYTVKSIIENQTILEVLNKRYIPNENEITEISLEGQTIYITPVEIQEDKITFALSLDKNKVQEQILKKTQNNIPFNVIIPLIMLILITLLLIILLVKKSKNYKNKFTSQQSSLYFSK